MGDRGHSAGRTRRGPPRAFVLGLGLALFGPYGPGCGGDEPAPEQTRRRHLMPRNLEQERAKRREAERVTAEDGSLLPSTDHAAGILLPRGLRLLRQREHRWYYQTRASLEALRAYFGPRLMTGQVELAGRGTVTYVKAQPNDTDKRRAVSVRIGPAPSNPRENQVFINEHAFKPKKRLTRAQIEAQIEARRKYAD